jgi:hypothetical protein
MGHAMNSTIEFWHPRKGGWYLGTLLEMHTGKGITYAAVKPAGSTRRILIPIKDLREAKRG